MTDTTSTGPTTLRDLRSTSNARVVEVVDRVIADIALDGERRQARLRLIITGAICVLWPVLCGFADDRTAFVPVQTVCVAALVASLAIWVLIRRRGTTTAAFSLGSAILDVVIAGSIGAAVILAPPADFTGLLHTTGFPILYIAVAAAGLRSSRRGVVVAAMSAVLVLLLLHGFDRARNAGRSVDDAVHVGIGTALVLAAMGVALANVRRAREVSLGVARQTLLAERARSTLGSYLSPEIAAQALSNDGVRLGGTRQRVAILFTDLRGFTSLSESADPEMLVRDLNEYFDHMVGAIRAAGGVVDKYIGDSIMAVFGAPTPHPDDAARAIRAAHALQQALGVLNAQRERAGKKPIAHGVGVHFGEVIAGNIGTAERAQYTVIGDAVNVAARLESATKELGVGVLISAEAIDAAGNADKLPDLRDIGSIAVKGRTGALRVATLVDEPTGSNATTRRAS
jgi:class 3 adenylate cyclase